MHYSIWDKPMIMLDELQLNLLRVSPIHAAEVAEIRKHLIAIMKQQQQQDQDLDAIFSVLESIQSRTYANEQEPHSDYDTF